MTIKSVLTFGCWMLLASALLSNPASADPPGIDPALLSGSGNSGVISVNAPPQPPEPGRTKFLPPQPEGVINLNAPSQQGRRHGALTEFVKKDCTPGTPGCSSFQRTQMRMDLPHFSMSSMSSGIGGAAGRIR